jgi:hypothetical protein
MTTTADTRAELITELSADRLLAHRFLFEHRHTVEGPPFHAEVIKTWHDPANERIVTEAFRGGGKSTIAEEWFIIRACLREFKNGLIVGASEERAMERLESIKHELETNQTIADLFGALRGPIWAGHKIVLSNGVVIQAVGRGQSLRGIKHHEHRPDCCLIDDFEDAETVSTEGQIKKGLRWVNATLLPALRRMPASLVRFVGNRLAPRAVIVQLAGDPSWKAQRFPVMYRDLETGEMRSAWPEMFPLDRMMQERASAQRLGLLDDFNREFMCEADAPEERPFRRDMFKLRPRVRTWEPVWCFFDPARGTGPRSTTTGFAAWSYVGSRIVVWDAWARRLMPDQIIGELFKADAEFRPVAIGVEETGLKEWLNQAVRVQITRRGQPIPFRPVKAPQEVGSKSDFIAMMQPYFMAGEVEWAKPLPELEAHLLGGGVVDDVNALAYFTRLRPGLPVYDEWSQQTVVESIEPSDRTLFLAMNATKGYVTGALCQFDGRLAVLADWVEEGEAGQVAPRLVAQAQLEAGRPVEVVMGPLHFDVWQNVGLRAALIGAAVKVEKVGVAPDVGRAEVRRLLVTHARGLPSVLIGQKARWTLNAFAGGFARDVSKSGLLDPAPAEGAYKTLMEGIESFAGLLKLGTGADDDQAINYRTGRGGVRYRSAYVEPRAEGR